MLALAEKTKTVPTAIKSKTTAAIFSASRLPFVSLTIFLASTYSKKRSAGQTGFSPHKTIFGCPSQIAAEISRNCNRL